MVAAGATPSANVTTPTGAMTEALGEDDWVFAGSADWWAGDHWWEFWKDEEPEPIQEGNQRTFINTNAMRRKLTRYKMEQAFRAAERANGGPLDPKAAAVLEAQVVNEANKEISRAIDMNDRASVLFVDEDADGTTQRITEKGLKDYARGALPDNPLLAGVVGGAAAGSLAVATMGAAPAAAAGAAVLDKATDGAVGDLADKVLGGTLRMGEAWMRPYSHDTLQTKDIVGFDPETGEKVTTSVQEYGTTYNRQGLWGILSWVFQASPSTALSTAAAAGQEIQAREQLETGEPVGSQIPFLRLVEDAWDGWGTEEALANIRRGDEMMFHAQDIGASPEADMIYRGVDPVLDTVASIWYEDEQSRKAVVDAVKGVGISLGIALVEPDLIFLSTLGTGKAARAGKALSQGRKAIRLSEQAADLEKAADAAAALQATTNTAEGTRASGFVSPTLGEGPAGDSKFLDDMEEQAIGVMADLPPQVRSSVVSHMSMRTGWSPMLAAKLRKAADAANAARRRFEKMFDDSQYVQDTAKPPRQLGEGMQEPQPVPAGVEPIPQVKVPLTAAERRVVKNAEVTSERAVRAKNAQIKAEKKVAELIAEEETTKARHISRAKGAIAAAKKAQIKAEKKLAELEAALAKTAESEKNAASIWAETNRRLAENGKPPKPQPAEWAKRARVRKRQEDAIEAQKKVIEGQVKKAADAEDLVKNADSFKSMKLRRGLASARKAREKAEKAERARVSAHWYKNAQDARRGLEPRQYEEAPTSRFLRIETGPGKLNMVSRRRATRVAEAEWDMVSRMHLSEELVAAELKHQLTFLERAVEGTGGAHRLSVAEQHKLSDVAEGALDQANQARVTMFAATDPAARAAAEATFKTASEAFRTASRQMVDDMGAAGLEMLRTHVDKAEAARKSTESRVIRLGRDMMEAQAAGRLNKVRRGVLFIDHAERVGGHAKAIAKLKGSNIARDTVRGMNMLETLEDVLRAHARSYDNLSQAVAGKKGTQLGGAPQAKVLEGGSVRKAIARSRVLKFNEDGVASVGKEEANAIYKVLEELVGGEKALDNLLIRIREKSPDHLLARILDITEGKTASTAVQPDELMTAGARLEAQTAIEAERGVALATGAEARKEWIVYASSSYNTTFMQETLAKTTTTLNRMYQTLKNPTSDILGPSAQEFHQLAKGAMDTQRVGMKELSKLYEETQAWARDLGMAVDPLTREMVPVVSRGQGMRIGVARYLDGADVGKEGIKYEPGFESVLMGSAQEGTLWERARAFMHQMAQAGETTEGMRALSRMWLPPGYDAAMVSARLGKKVNNLVGKGQRTLGEDLTEAAAALLKEESLSFDEFANKMKFATEQLLTGYTKDVASVRKAISGEGARAYGFAAQAVLQGAILGRMTQSVAGKIAGFTEESMKAAEAIAMGVEPMATGHYTEALALLNRMGIPPKTRSLVQEGAQDLQAGLIMLNKGDTVDAALIPRLWMNSMDDVMETIVKSTEEFAGTPTNPFRNMVSGVPSRFMRLWRMSITTGLIWHSPRYLTAMMVGNMSQVFATGDIRTTVGTAAQMGTYAAVHGRFSPLRMMVEQGSKSDAFRRALDAPLVRNIAKYGEDNALPGPMSVLYNNHMAGFFDANKVADSVKIRTSEGDYVTMGWLRQQALEQGVLSTYASNELIDILSRTADTSFDRSTYTPGQVLLSTLKGASEGGAKEGVKAGAKQVGKIGRALDPRGRHSGPLKYLERRGGVIADFADSIEQRQRAGLFLDHVINRGYSPEKAGELVRDSLFDWGHAMSKYEAEHINQWILFYRFYKVSLGQGLNVLTDGFRRGFSGDFKATDAMGMNNALGRQRIMVNAAQGYREPAQAELRQEESEYMRLMAERYPGWSGSRATPFASQMPLTEAEMMDARRWGKDVTHKAKSMPNATTFDSTALWLHFLLTVGRGVNGDQGALPAAQSVMNELAQRSGPLTSALYKGALEHILGLPSPMTSPDPRVRPTERAILGLAEKVTGTPIMSRRLSTANRDADLRGDARVAKGSLMVLRALPAIGSEIPYWVDPVLTAPAFRSGREDVSMPQEMADNISYLIRQYTSMGKEYLTNPEKDARFTNDILKSKMNSEINRKRNSMYLMYRDEGLDWLGRMKEEDL